MNLDTYRQLRSQARRLTGNANDAEDLVQDVLLAAVQAQRMDLPWLSGTLRNLAAMQVRSAVRRRQRERHAAQMIESINSQDRPGKRTDTVTLAAPCWLQDWAPSLRQVAVLALHGLSAGEICWILQLSPEAFRQRLSRLRKRLEKLSPNLRAEALALAYLRDPERTVELQFGLVRRALLAALNGKDGLATHDTDGHLLVIRHPGHDWAAGGNQ